MCVFDFKSVLILTLYSERKIATRFLHRVSDSTSYGKKRVIAGVENRVSGVFIHKLIFSGMAFTCFVTVPLH